MIMILIIINQQIDILSIVNIKCLLKGGDFMTELEQIKAAKAAYAREWRKRNPERSKEIQKRYWKKRFKGGEKDGKETADRGK